MPSIVSELLAESSQNSLDTQSLRKRNLRYLFEAGGDEKKVDTAMQKSAKAMKALAGKLAGELGETSGLVTKAGANLTKAIAAGEKDEESAALFSLSNQFGASLLSLLNAMQEAVDTAADTERGNKLVTILDGEDELKKIIEKTFKPSPNSIKLIQQANELVAKAKGIAKAVKDSGAVDASSEADENEGRGSDDIFEMGDVGEVDEGLFSNIGNFLKGLFKQVPTDAKGTIKSLMPLFGGGNIAKALLTDLKSDKMTGKKFSEVLAAIKPSLEELSPGPEKVDTGGGGSEGGGDKGEGGGTPSAGADRAAENPAAVRTVAAETEGLSPAVAKALISISKGTDPKEAAKDLSDDEKKFLSAVLSRFGKAEKGDSASDIVNDAKKDSGVKGTEGSGDEGEFKYGKYIDVEKIKKVAGDKGPKAVDSLLGKSDELRKKLGIKDSRNRVGRVMRESMYSFLFEEVDDAVVKAFKDGLKKDVIGKELSDDEAKEIAQSIASKAGGGEGDKKKEGDEGGDSLSKLLFVANDPEDDSKGFRLRQKMEPGSKASDIARTLDNLVDADINGSWPKTKDKPNSANRKEFLKTLQKLKKGLEGVKLESRLNDDNLVMERWQRLAGLKD